MTVDIIIPVYNTSPLLPRCIDSVVAQKHSDWRLWLIDDGSTDDSYDICLRYARCDARIRAYTKPNGGAADSRNYGLDLLTKHHSELGCQAVVFCDSDDTLHPDYLQELTRYSADCILCGIKHLYHTHTSEVNPPEASYPNPYGDARFLSLFKTGLLNSPCNKLYRLDLINRHRLRFDTRLYNEDIAYNVRYFGHCATVVSVSLPLYHYHHRAGSITTNVPEQAFTDYIALHQTMLKLIGRVHQSEIDDFVSYQYTAIALRMMRRRQYKMPAHYLREPMVQRAMRAHRPYSKVDAVQSWLLSHRWLRLYYMIFLRKEST